MNVVIFGLKNSTLIPYVLYLRNQIPEGDLCFEEMLGILESFVIRRMVCRETTKNYNRLFRSLVREQVNTSDLLREKLTNQDDVTTAWPTDLALKKSFHEEHKLASLPARGILYLLEAAVWPQDSGASMLGFSSYSLEHLMPKKWRNHWGRLDSFEKENERDVKLLTLGNLAIITQSLNGSISDSGWIAKKEGNAKHDGLELCTGGLRSMSVPLKSCVWNEELMSNRADELFSYAEKVWGHQGTA